MSDPAEQLSQAQETICQLQRELDETSHGLIMLTAELQRSEKKYRDIFENAVEGIFQCSPEGRFLAANPAMVRIFDYESPEALMAQVTEMGRQLFVDPERCSELHRLVMEKGRVQGFEVQAYRKDGTKIWTSWHVAMIRDKDGVFFCCEGSVEDITERRRSEDVLAKLSRAVDQTEDSVFITDRNGMIEYVNPAFEKLTGFGNEEVFGKSPRILKSGRHEAEFYQKLWETVCSGRTFRAEIINKKKSGELFWEEKTISPMKDARGNVTHFISTSKDITDRKRVQALLEVKTSQLEAITEATTRFLSDGDFSAASAKLLSNAIKHTGSEYGFIGVVVDGPVLRILAHEGVVWHTDVNREFYEQALQAYRETGYLEFRNFNNLFGRVITSGALVVANEAGTDPRAGGSLPPGHPRLDRFLDVPILRGSDVVGIIGVANKPSDYAETDSEKILILTHAASVLYDNYKRLEHEALTEAKRRHAEETLRKTEALYRRAIEAGDAVAYVRDYPSGTFSYMGEGIESLSGYTSEEMTPVLWEKIAAQLCFRGELAGLSFEEAVREVRSGKVRQWKCDCLITKRNGEKRWISDVSVEIIGESGESVGSLGLLQDITERMQSEEATREQARLLDLARDAILVHDLQSWISFWNKGAERLYGWSAEEAIGRKLTDLFRDAASSYEERIAVVLGKKEWTGETRQKAKDGKILIVNSRMTLVRGRDGARNKVLVINTDITEAKSIESQLLRAQRLESIGTLAGGIAHDLNNILTPIIMAADILSMKLPAEDSKSKPILDLLSTNAKRGSEIVKQVLTFARGAAGDRVQVQLRHLINEMLKITLGTFPKNIRFESDVSQDLWLVDGDATQLHQVLLNLSLNARDAMPDGGRLLIRAHNLIVDESYAGMTPGAKAGNYVILEVSDSGTGIPPDILDRVFDPFFTTKGPGKGTGLGLSTVLGIVKSHGGIIHVSNQPIHGATFKVFLPACLDAAEINAKPTAKERLRGKGETILLVDDEPHIRRLAETVLIDHGYKVLLAEDGAEGVARFAEHLETIDAVVTDIMMPTMDGLALVRSIRKIDPGVRIVVCSGLPGGFGPESKVEELRSLGIKTSIPKPYTTEELLRALHETLH